MRDVVITDEGPMREVEGRVGPGQGGRTNWKEEWRRDGKGKHRTG